MIVVGIDPGKRGGLSMIDTRPHETPEGWACIAYVNLGVIMPNSPELVANWLNSLPQRPDVAYIENVHAMPGQGVTSMFNFGKGFGEILGVCAALDICVELVSPQKWKRAVLSGTAKDKAAAIEFVQREYPMINLVPGRCRVPQDGIADAVCIAHYGMLMEVKK